MADINEGEALNVAAGLREAGFEAQGLAVDVTSEQSVAAMVEHTIAWTGRIDTAIANAGIMVEGDILSVSLDDWQRAIDVNTTGTFLTARKVLPHLIEGGGGTLVFTASTVGLVGMKGTAAYSASKGAIVALTRQLAADYADRGVRVAMRAVWRLVRIRRTPPRLRHALPAAGLVLLVRRQNG